MSHSWEAPLLAPVAGTVVVALDTVEDSEGMNLVAEKEDAAGNVVVIETADGYFVVLAHLRQGTLAVKEGDAVEPGQAIALAGNSGNTTLSHLHMQVQTHAELWDEENRSVPFGFGAGVLSRNDRVSGAEGPSPSATPR